MRALFGQYFRWNTRRTPIRRPKCVNLIHSAFTILLLICYQPLVSVRNKKNLQHRRVISYSLYGDDARYIEGALANALLYKHIYAGWEMRVYHDSTVPIDVLIRLREQDVELVDMSLSKLNKMTWRFLVASDSNLERACVRDIDSRLSLREKAAVEEWLATDKAFHVMRDHPSHSKFALSGGMWCCTSRAFSQMEDLLNRISVSDEYLRDMDFLNTAVWPVAKTSVLQHDAFSCKKFGGKPFPTARRDFEHVGSVFINGTMRVEDVVILAKAIEAGEENLCT